MTVPSHWRTHRLAVVQRAVRMQRSYDVRQWHRLNEEPMHSDHSQPSLSEPPFSREQPPQPPGWGLWSIAVHLDTANVQNVRFLD